MKMIAYQLLLAFWILDVAGDVEPLGVHTAYMVAMQHEYPKE